MKGRGSRVMTTTTSRHVTDDPAARTKTHFVIVDAVGVTDVDQQDTVPLERRRSESLKKLFERVGYNTATLDDITSIASRLARLNRELNPLERDEIADAGGPDLSGLVGRLMDVTDPDRRRDLATERARAEHGEDPGPEQVDAYIRQRSWRRRWSRFGPTLGCGPRSSKSTARTRS
jgi:type I restriction enzyme, R subunit